MSSDLQGAVGQSVLRREDDYLLRGQGRFVDDLPTPLNTLHLAFVLSPYAHARIASIDASEALALDGVVDVFTGADLAAMVKPIAAQIELPGYSPNARDVLAIDEVRFAGEAVAVVVAESQYLAEDGLELVDVDYEPLPAVVPGRRGVNPAGHCSRRRRRIRHQGGPLPRGIRLRRARPAAAPAHQVGPGPVRRPAHRRPRP